MANGKRRTRSQRVGDNGEEAFVLVAGGYGLIANKPRDYGLDYLCQVEDVPDAKATARILGDVVGAVVRSSEANRPRLRLSKDDAARIVQSKIPILLALPSRPPKAPAWTVLVKAVDVPLINDLADFLVGTQKTLSLPPSGFAPQTKFGEELLRCLPPSLAEQYAITLAEHRLKGLLPGSEVTIVRKATAAASFVQTSDFLSQFTIASEQDWLTAHRIAVRDPDRLAAFTSTFSIKPEILAALQSLPQPVMIGGPLALAVAGPTMLYARGPAGSVVACQFQGSSFGKHVSYEHASGFTITVSDRMEREGVWVHFIDADCPRPIDLLAHPDLFQFLVHCVPGATWSPDPSGEGIPSARSGDLANFAVYAYELDRADPARSERRLWTIGGVPTIESSMMLALVGAARRDAFQFGFTLGKRSHEREEAAEFAVAVVARAGTDTMIAWFLCEGALLKRGKYIVGLKIAAVDDVEIEWRDGHIAKETDAPELVVRDLWPVFSFGVRDTRAADPNPALSEFQIRFRNEAPSPPSHESDGGKTHH